MFRGSIIWLAIALILVLLAIACSPPRTVMCAEHRDGSRICQTLPINPA